MFTMLANIKTTLTQPFYVRWVGWFIWNTFRVVAVISCHTVVKSDHM